MMQDIVCSVTDRWVINGPTVLYRVKIAENKLFLKYFERVFSMTQDPARGANSLWIPPYSYSLSFFKIHFLGGGGCV